MGLNKVRHKELLIDLANDERKGRKKNVPKTMSAAMARIKEFIPNSNKGGGYIADRGEPAVYDARAAKPKTCFKCGSDSHLWAQCPERADNGTENKKQIVKKQGVKPVVHAHIIGSDSDTDDEDYLTF